MNLSGISNTVAPSVSASGPEGAPQKASVIPIRERQVPAASGNSSPPQAVNDARIPEKFNPAEVMSELVQNLKLDSELQFEVDDSTGDSIVTVLDGQTGEVIRRFPTEESLAIARHIAEFADAPRVGLLLDSQE